MVTCSIATSILGCLVTTYLYFRYTWCMDIPAKALIFAAFIVIGCIPLLVSYNFEKILGTAYPFYRNALYFIFIGCIILFTVTLISDAVMLLIAYTPLIGKLKVICCHINTFNITLALIFTAWAMYEGVKVPAVKELTLSSSKISQPLKIAVLSDLHIHRTICPDKIKGIIEKTNAQNPDIILLAGDILDDDVNKISEISALLKNLKAPKGIYFVTGNHEFYTGYKETVDELQKLGFTFLENDGVMLNDNIYLAGIPDLFSGKDFGKNIDIRKAFQNSHEGQYRLLISHTPADFGVDNVFDLELSGHTHGGQIFPFHIFAKLHNHYLSGLYPMSDKTQIYVSNGAGQWGPQMRFLAPSEISIINLLGEKH